MNRKIARNIAIVSAFFIVTFSIMLITNYFQVRGFNPLQTEVIETLKEINDENAGNTELQEQIRQLDLLARRAYFVRLDHLKTGIYLLIGMLVVFIVAARYYFAEIKNIPEKDIDPIDEWAEKTMARKYVNWVAGGLSAVALCFALLSSPYLSNLKKKDLSGEKEKTAETKEVISDSDEDVNNLPNDTELLTENTEEKKDSVPTIVDSPPATTVPVDSTLTAAEPELPKVTHNSFRGNNSAGTTAARNVPVKWNLSTGENIAWKSDIARHGYNSPVVNGNKIFITGADEQARELYCYDLNTGELLWQLAADNIAGSPAQIPKTSDDTGLAASTVTTNGKQVCAIFATGDLICADMDGKRLWTKNLGVPVNHYGYASSLLTFGNLLIVQYDNSNSPKILALDMETGAVRWDKTRTDKITWSSPIIAYIDRKPQLILMGNPSISSYNPNNGEKNWSVDFLSGEVASSPCCAAGLVFGASEYSSLVAVDAVSGEKLWEANDFLPEVSSPVATKDNVYLATSYGVVACYDAKSGELKKSLETNTEFYSSPVIAEGRIYLFSNSGQAFIYSANSELTLISSFETGEKTFATPAFTDGRIVVRTENSIYCVMAKKS
ncbi:MAG: PQQ-binding-like beta-propeller repeat protein [Bacteroidales bacterium]|jgi:outer membrane protein assembly factor BamB|nr:PQQ-binding-like beta-propeller repeat protein [Bacteroidales bacterium]